MWVPRFVCMVSVGLIISGVVSGQDYPTKPVRIVTSPIGGGTDFVARQIAQGIAGSLGQPVIIDNRPSGVIPGDTVAKAAPDGYTLLAAGGLLWIGPLLEKTPFDPVKDFSPISLTARSPNVLVVHPSLPVKSVKDLIALAKARPGDLNYGSTGSGASNHLAAELFKFMAGVDIVRIAYKGTPQIVTELIGGQTQLAFSSATTAVSHISSGRLKGLAVTTAAPSPLVPGLPTVAASGLPGYEAASPDAILAPAKTSVAIINRLSQEIVRVLSRADVKEKFLAAGVETVGSTPEETSNKIKFEIVTWGKVLKGAGIKSE